VTSGIASYCVLGMLCGAFRLSDFKALRRQR
jgi:hypothetical protein